MKKITRKALVIAIIAGLLVLVDGIITNTLNLKASFTWVAFVSWTVFFGATSKERFKAIPGYIIGFLFAVAIIKFGSILTAFMPLKFLGVAIGSIFATTLINFLCVEMESLDKFFPVSISGMFVGIAMTFSGLGIGLTTNSVGSSLLMLFIIVIYGILGLVSGWASIKFGTK